MLKTLIDWYLRTLETGCFSLAALLMDNESFIVSLPSEFVIPLERVVGAEHWAEDCIP